MIVDAHVKVFRVVKHRFDCVTVEYSSVQCVDSLLRVNTCFTRVQKRRGRSDGYP